MNWAITTRSGSITIDQRIPTPAAVVGYDADTVAWAAAVVTAGGSVSDPRKAYIDALIVGLKADGIWTKLDRLWLFAAENSQSALVDLKARVTATAVNTPSFTADDGYSFDGSTNYINTGFDPTAVAGNYILNSSHFAAWVFGATLSGMVIGVYDGAAQSYLQLAVGGSWTIQIDDNSAGVFGTWGVGWNVVTRTASNARAIYKNGSSYGSDTAASASLINGHTFWAGARNTAGSYGLGWQGQMSAVSIGAGLNATDNTNLYNKLRTYMTAVGVP